MFSVEGKRVAVVGAARSGIAAADLLARRGASVVLSETRDGFDGADRLRDAGVTLELGGHKAETLAGADLIVTSPGVPTDQAVFDGAKQRGVEIIGELELAWRWTSGRVIAITGTKGKSTTTTLIGRMLAAQGRTVLVGGNIGVPLSAQVDQSTPETVHVVEASSFQLETTSSFRPWIAVWLNVADDHLDRHPDVASYVAAKARIFANQTAEDWAVVNADDPVVLQQSESTRARRVAYSLSGAVDQGFVVDGDWIVERTGTGVERLIPLSMVELTGRHMLHNVLAATAATSIAGVAAGRVDRSAAWIPRPRARHGAGRRVRGRAVRERLEGDQRGGGQTIDRELRSRRGGDRGRQVQGRRPARPARAAGRARARGGGYWRGRAAGARGADRNGAGHRGAVDAGSRAAWDSRQRRRTAWCCWRRRARASTGFATTRSADGRSEYEVQRLKEKSRC